MHPNTRTNCIEQHCYRKWYNLGSVLNLYDGKSIHEHAALNDGCIIKLLLSFVRSNATLKDFVELFPVSSHI